MGCRVKPQDAALVAKAIPPDYAVGAHTAPLGLTWATNAMLPAPFQHGMPSVILSGFLTKDGKDAQGRPVAVAMDGQGALLVADDVGNTVWRVSAAGGTYSKPKIAR